MSVVTGNGLKDVANAIKACGEPISIPSDMDLLLRAFDEHGCFDRKIARDGDRQCVVGERHAAPGALLSVGTGCR